MHRLWKGVPSANLQWVQGEGEKPYGQNIEPATPHKEIPGFLSLEKKGKLVSERKASKKKLEDVLSSHPISGSSKEDSASSDLDGVPTAWLERQKKARGSKTGTRKTAAMKIKTELPSPRKRALATASQAKKRFWGHGRKGPRKEGSVVDLTK